MLKAFLAESQVGVTPNTWWTYEFAGHNKEATLELKNLFDGIAPVAPHATVVRQHTPPPAASGADGPAV